MLALDGVYVVGQTSEAPEFVPLEAPSDAEVLRLAETVARRVMALFKRRNLGTEEDSGPPREPELSDVYVASTAGRVAAGHRTGQRVKGLKSGGDNVDVEDAAGRSGQRCGSASGFSLHANVGVPAGDRQRLARLIRYVARPPLCADRLDGMEDGRLVYRFKTPWRDGTDRVMFEPEDFVARLAALVPKPRAHLIRFSGVLAPAAKWRAAIVPSQPAEADTLALPDTAAAGAPIEREANAVPGRRRNYLWADLLRRTFAIDVLACGHCGGPSASAGRHFPTQQHPQDSGVPRTALTSTATRARTPRRVPIRLARTL